MTATTRLAVGRSYTYEIHLSYCLYLLRCRRRQSWDARPPAPLPTYLVVTRAHMASGHLTGDSAVFPLVTYLHRRGEDN